MAITAKQNYFEYLSTNLQGVGKWDKNEFGFAFKSLI